MKKKSYNNYGEKYTYPEYSIEDWKVALKHYSILKKSGYKESEIDRLLIDKYFENNYEFSRFKHWSRHKMSKDDSFDKIVKESTWNAGIVPGHHYDGQIYNLPGSSFYSGDSSIQKAKELKESKSKSKRSPQDTMNRNIMSMMRVLQREDMDFETYSEAMSSLVSLMNIFKKKFSNKMLANATVRTAGKLKKLGLNNHAKSLSKFSQQLEQTPQEQAAAQPQEQAAAQPQEQAAAQPQEQAAAQPPQPGSDEFKISQMPEQEPVDVRDIKTPGPTGDDYKFVLDGPVNIDQAASKLDQVASTLSDRRVIRMLAEFDIMLDQIGIASMFPELAESQSKLIDAFSYALTRVSKMMGQISNARTLLASSNSIPGAATPAEGSEDRGADPIEEQQVGPQGEDIPG